MAASLAACSASLFLSFSFSFLSFRIFNVAKYVSSAMMIEAIPTQSPMMPSRLRPASGAVRVLVTSPGLLEVGFAVVVDVDIVVGPDGSVRGEEEEEDEVWDPAYHRVSTCHGTSRNKVV